MSKDREKKRRPILKIVLLILTTISLISSAFAIYEILSLQSIENLIRYIVVGVLVLIDLIIVLKTKSICKKLLLFQMLLDSCHFSQQLNQ